MHTHTKHYIKTKNVTQSEEEESISINHTMKETNFNELSRMHLHGSFVCGLNRKREPLDVFESEFVKSKKILSVVSVVNILALKACCGIN